MAKSKRKKGLEISLEASLFLEFRKVMFREGFTPHEFISCIAELVAIRDPDMDIIIKKLKTRGKSFKKGQKIEADELYRQIENKLAASKKDKGSN